MKKTFIVKCLGILLAANLFTASAEAAQINTKDDFFPETGIEKWGKTCAGPD